MFFVIHFCDGGCTLSVNFIAFSIRPSSRLFNEDGPNACMKLRSRTSE